MLKLIKDDAVRQFAEFISGLLRILFKIAPESYALCCGHADQLREQLKAMDLAPFAEMAQWWNQTYLQGCQLGEIPLGISLWLRSVGFQCIIWGGSQHNTILPERILADIMKKYPALLEVFSEHKAGDTFWSTPEIIPFDAVVDWVKKLQLLLKRLQETAPAGQ